MSRELQWFVWWPVVSKTSVSKIWILPVSSRYNWQCQRCFVEILCSVIRNRCTAFIPALNLELSENCPKIFLSENFLLKVQNLGLTKHIWRWPTWISGCQRIVSKYFFIKFSSKNAKFWAQLPKLQFWAPIVYSVGNLQSPFVKILSTNLQHL